MRIAKQLSEITNTKNVATNGRCKLIDTILTVVGLSITGLSIGLNAINNKIKDSGRVSKLADEKQEKKIDELRADMGSLKDQVRATDIDIYKNQVVIVEKAAYEKGFREGKAAVK